MSSGPMALRTAACSPQQRFVAERRTVT
jgi:hypothetical protein